jgi:hypothetical protein
VTYAVGRLRPEAEPAGLHKAAEAMLNVSVGLAEANAELLENA